MYVYIQSEKTGWFPSPKQSNSVWLTGSLWTVGFYSPDGKWNPESDHETPEKAAERVNWLNGGNLALKVTELERQIRLHKHLSNTSIKAIGKPLPSSGTVIIPEVEG